jgi:hypothetical protein
MKTGGLVHHIQYRLFSAINISVKLSAIVGVTVLSGLC